MDPVRPKIPAPQIHVNVANCSPSIEGSTNYYLNSGFESAVGIDLQKLPDFDFSNDFEDFDDQNSDDLDQDDHMQQGLRQF